MDENRAYRVVDALRERGVPAHVAREGVGLIGIRVVIFDGREAVWDTDGTAGLEAQVMRDGVLVGFVPHDPGIGGLRRGPGHRRDRPRRLRPAGGASCAPPHPRRPRRCPARAASSAASGTASADLRLAGVAALGGSTLDMGDQRVARASGAGRCGRSVWWDATSSAPRARPMTEPNQYTLGDMGMTVERGASPATRSTPWSARTTATATAGST